MGRGREHGLRRRRSILSWRRERDCCARRHYDRRTRALSLADCVAAETARRLDAALATADPPLLETCEAEGIAVIAFPGSKGTVWPRS